jgi:hypothetical protein
MIRRALSVLILVAAIIPATAAERVTVATMRLTENGAVFLAGPPLTQFRSAARYCATLL